MKTSWQKLYDKEKLENKSQRRKTQECMDTINRYPAIPSLDDECSWFSWIYIFFPFHYDMTFSLRDTKTEGVPKLHESQYNIRKI